MSFLNEEKEDSSDDAGIVGESDYEEGIGDRNEGVAHNNLVEDTAISKLLQKVKDLEQAYDSMQIEKIHQEHTARQLEDIISLEHSDEIYQLLLDKSLQLANVMTDVDHLKNQVKKMEQARQEEKIKLVGLSVLVKSLQSVSDNLEQYGDPEYLEQQIDLDDVRLAADKAVDMVLKKMKDQVERSEEKEQALNQKLKGKDRRIEYLKKDIELYKVKFEMLEEIFIRLTEDRQSTQPTLVTPLLGGEGNVETAAGATAKLLKQDPNKQTNLRESQASEPRSLRARRERLQKTRSFSHTGSRPKHQLLIDLNNSYHGESKKSPTLLVMVNGQTAKYTGSTNSKGNPHGTGALRFKHGDTYLGDLQNGMMHGKGAIYHRNGVQWGEYYENILIENSRTKRGARPKHPLTTRMDIPQAKRDNNQVEDPLHQYGKIDNIEPSDRIENQHTIHKPKQLNNSQDDDSNRFANKKSRPSLSLKGAFGFSKRKSKYHSSNQKAISSFSKADLPESDIVESQDRQDKESDSTPPNNSSSNKNATSTKAKLTILAGRDLVAKDKDIFGHKTTSDPYVEVWDEHKRFGKTPVFQKTLNPVWEKDNTFETELEGENPQVTLKINDWNRIGGPDAMGTIVLEIPTKTVDITDWFAVPKDSAKDASGEIQIRLQTTKQTNQQLELDTLIVLKQETSAAFKKKKSVFLDKKLTFENKSTVIIPEKNDSSQCDEFKETRSSKIQNSIVYGMDGHEELTGPIAAQCGGIQETDESSGENQDTSYSSEEDIAVLESNDNDHLADDNERDPVQTEPELVPADFVKRITPSNNETSTKVKLTILAGRDLVAKDKDIFGHKTTSDPYVEVWDEHKRFGKTPVFQKTLNPVWEKDNTFETELEGENPQVTLKINDWNRIGGPDAMGTIVLEIPTKTVDITDWFAVPKDSAKDASGEIQIRLQTNDFISAESDENESESEQDIIIEADSVSDDNENDPKQEAGIMEQGFESEVESSEDDWGICRDFSATCVENKKQNRVGILIHEYPDGQRDGDNADRKENQDSTKEEETLESKKVKGNNADGEEKVARDTKKKGRFSVKLRSLSRKPGDK